jgi:HD-GYP domain-containing protein (c-di-GMP phosphodiesterase class II)
VSEPTPIPSTPAPAGDESSPAVEHGAALLVRLSALLRTGRTYDITNQAFQKQLHDCMAVLQRVLEEEDEVTLVAVTDYFYLNGVRIKAQASLLTIYHGLMQEFEKRSLGGLRVLQGVTPAEFERFFQLFLAADDPAIAERLVEAVKEASIEHVVPVAALELEEDEITRSMDQNEQTPAGERGRARRIFWRAVLGTKKIVVRTMQTGRPDLRHAKRLVQPIVDGIMRHEYSIVGLTALKDHDEYTYAHCVNVSILSVSMGQALGLSRQTLADLGVAGLMHDLGKIAVPGDVLRKPAALSAEEWTMIRRHPIEGMKSMFRMPGLSTLMVDTMRVCLEHHMNFDRTGYPDIQTEWGQSTLSRIVAVADCFDAMTAHRVYHKRPRTAFEGLQYLFGPARVAFDPAVLWALAHTTGLYPPGSVLTTESGYMVLSISPNPADLRRPHCRVLVRPDGSAPPEDAPEFWEPMPATESVARVLKPEDHSVNTNELLAA